MVITGQERTARIDHCTAAEAISMWLDGDYRCGDERALLVVIRRDARTALSDPEIRDLIHEASERGLPPEFVLGRLTTAVRAEEHRGGTLPR